MKEAWGFYKKNLGMFLISTFIIIALGSMPKESNIFIKIIFNIASLFFSFLVIKATLILLDGGEFNPFKKEIIPTIRQFWNFVKTAILSALCILPMFLVFGIIFTIIGAQAVVFSELIIIALGIMGILFLIFLLFGLYFITRLVFSTYISIEKNQGARASVKESWNMTKGNEFKILGKLVLIFLIMLAGIIVFFVGIFVTYPLAIIMIVMLYREFSRVKGPIATEEVKEVEPEVIKEDAPAESTEEAK